MGTFFSKFFFKKMFFFGNDPHDLRTLFSSIWCVSFTIESLFSHFLDFLSVFPLRKTWEKNLRTFFFKIFFDTNLVFWKWFLWFLYVIFHLFEVFLWLLNPYFLTFYTFCGYPCWLLDSFSRNSNPWFQLVKSLFWDIKCHFSVQSFFLSINFSMIMFVFQTFIYSDDFQKDYQTMTSQS